METVSSGAGQGDITASLNLVLDLNEGEAEPLIKEQSVTKNTLVELRKVGESLKLWPIFLGVGDGKDFMRIERDSGLNQIMVIVGKFGEGGTTLKGFTMAVERDTRIFTCKSKEIKVGRSGLQMLYQGTMKKIIPEHWQSVDSKPLEISVSLAKCTLGEDKKTAECDLKPVKKLRKIN